MRGWFMPLVLMLPLLVMLPSCESKKTPSAPPTSQLKGAVGTFECNRCHIAQENLPPAPTKKNCVGCHRAIQQGLFDNKGYEKERVEGWKKRIHHLLEVPSLTGSSKRFRRDWFVRFLQKPYDVRPRIGAQMPRFRMTSEQANRVADHFFAKAPAQDTSPIQGDLTKGRAILEEHGCTSCHAFGGVTPTLTTSAVPVKMTPERLKRAMLQAPDLRHTRDRMYPTTVLAWIANPASIKPDTHMPTIPLTEQQQRDVTAFIMQTPLANVPPKPLPTRLPPLTRKISYDEVEKKVFKKVCWHCHSDPIPVQGDGGPGNTGGLGFKGLGIDFSSREALLKGGVDPQGNKIDLLAKDQAGTPHLIKHLMLRHQEVLQGSHPEPRGMPLGLPPMTLEEIQLVESWIAQGAGP